MSDTHTIWLGLAIASLAAVPGCLDSATISLTAKDLYNGFDARKVLLDAKGERLALDGRAFEFGTERQSVVVTDPIDLGASDGIVGLPGAVKSAEVKVAADVPDGSAVGVEVRSGANCLDTSSWSPWTKLSGLAGRADKLAGRYLQVRITLAAAKSDRLPALTGLTIRPTVEAGTAWAGKPTIGEAKIQKIVRSPIEFVYERPDSPKLVSFRKAAKLDEAVAGATDDFDRMVRLWKWVSTFKADLATGRQRGADGRYLWDIEKVFEMKDGAPKTYGHCMTYTEVMVSAATALGYPGARHMAILGFRETSHEIPEIWIGSLGKWVYLDASLSQYYTDKKTKVPMNLLEMHNVVADKFIPPGKDMHWWSLMHNEEAQERVRKVGGHDQINCVMGLWDFGNPMPANYDWAWQHGYLTAGFVQMTPRNDFNSNPKAMSESFEQYPGYDQYPFWVDAKTPPRTKEVGNWYTRIRDFYWTLDQASVRLVQAGEGTLMVELGQSMPFFKNYRLKIDGAEVGGAATPFGWRLKIDGAEVGGAATPFGWRLKPGANKLEVAPVDEFGRVGLASSVTVNYVK